MKRLIAAAVLAVIVAVVYFTGNFYIKNVLEDSYNLVDECNQSYESKQNPEKTAEKLKKYWSDNEGVLSLFAHHNHIDEVEKAIDTMVIYSNTENRELYYEYSGTVETLLHQLYEDNSLSMHSVF